MRVWLTYIITALMFFISGYIFDLGITLLKGVQGQVVETLDNVSVNLTGQHIQTVYDTTGMARTGFAVVAMLVAGAIFIGGVVLMVNAIRKTGEEEELAED